MTWMQLIVAEVCILVLGFLSPRISLFSLFAPLEWDWNIAKNVAWPLTFVYIGMMAFNNVCLKYVEVTFYQVARSLTILWTVFFTLILLKKEINKLAIVACLVVFSGFVLGSIGEVNFQWEGLIAGVLSSAFVAYYNIAIKSTLPVLGDSEWRLLIYNTTIAIVVFIPVLFATGEFILLESDPAKWPTQSTWNGIIVSGLLGFLINIAIFMQINYTSPLTGAISGTAKACVQTLLGWLIFRNPVSNLNFAGICTVIAGSAWYSQIQYSQMKAREQAKVEEKNMADTKV